MFRDLTLDPGEVDKYPDRFPISPLIRITLLALYATLMVPLPFLAAATNAAVSPGVLWGGIVVAGLAIYTALTQAVHTDGQGIRVQYPVWARWLWRGGWQLNWADIIALKPRSTGQGGVVYYLVSHDQQAYLLPMRIAGFARLVRQVEAETGIDTEDVKPLAQPWMYGILLGFTLLLAWMDLWTISTALQLGAGP
jgi:hypothetical protein